MYLLIVRIDTRAAIVVEEYTAGLDDDMDYVDLVQKLGKNFGRLQRSYVPPEYDRCATLVYRRSEPSWLGDAREIDTHISICKGG